MLLWLEESLPGELLLASLLATLDDPGTLLLDFLDETFEAGDEVLPVIVSDSATDLVTT